MCPSQSQGQQRGGRARGPIGGARTEHLSCKNHKISEPADDPLSHHSNKTPGPAVWIGAQWPSLADPDLGRSSGCGRPVLSRTVCSVTQAKGTSRPGSVPYHFRQLLDEPHESFRYRLAPVQVASSRSDARCIVLISATPSTYARKVRIALAEKSIPFELVTEVPWNRTTITPRYNP